MHAPIVRALKSVNASVAELNEVGGGVPDLLVGYEGVTYLIEIKTVTGIRNPKPSPLTIAQVEFHMLWRGAPIHVVTSELEALRVIGAAA